MILYSLNCACGHTFEDWFDNSADFDHKSTAGALVCPTCKGHDVHKAIMAPSLGAAAKGRNTALPPCMGGSGPEGGAACGGCCGGGPRNH